MSKHTPGPWPYDYVWSAVRHIERNCDFIESTEEPEFHWRDWEADARLIAAAPDLLDYAEKLLAHARASGMGTPIGLLLGLDRAVKKATGTQEQALAQEGGDGD